MQEELIEMARVRAIQEAICGFLLDEVINPNISVQCKEYDYVVTYARNTHSHMYKNEKKRNIKKKKHLVPASYISRH